MTEESNVRSMVDLDLMFIDEIKIEDMINYELFIKNFNSEYDVVPKEARLHHRSLLSFFQDIEKLKYIERTNATQVPQHLYVIKDENSMIYGVGCVRHSLSTYYKEYEGHIGLSIAPSFRELGLGKLFFKMLLEKAKYDLNLDELIICVNEENHASRKIVVTHGGIYHDKVYKHDGYIYRYKINLFKRLTNEQSIFLFNHQKDVKIDNILRDVASDVKLPLVSYKALAEAVFDHFKEHNYENGRKAHEIGYSIMTHQLNEYMNLGMDVIIDVSLSQDEYLNLLRFIHEKKVNLVSIYIKTDDEKLFYDYLDHERDLHALQKIFGLYDEKEYYKLRYISDLYKIPYNYQTTLDTKDVTDEIIKMIKAKG
ncbi:MAG: GNAT family N-acetyltransferase [Acholeplasmataceae bacterium]|jgi:predicted acetyltransferase|nr:GNAT family N-acetyltransferase [Acholeplasmataceae bacterium]